MNRRQARRISLAVNASYLLFGSPTDGITDLLSDEDIKLFEEAQRDIAYEMLKRAGFDEPMHAEEIVKAVLGT